MGMYGLLAKVMCAAEAVVKRKNKKNKEKFSCCFQLLQSKCYQENLTVHSHCFHKIKMAQC